MDRIIPGHVYQDLMGARRIPGGGYDQRFFLWYEWGVGFTEPVVVLRGIGHFWLGTEGGRAFRDIVFGHEFRYIGPPIAFGGSRGLVGGLGGLRGAGGSLAIDVFLQHTFLDRPRWERRAVCMSWFCEPKLRFGFFGLLLSRLMVRVVLLRGW